MTHTDKLKACLGDVPPSWLSDDGEVTGPVLDESPVPETPTVATREIPSPPQKNGDDTVPLLDNGETPDMPCNSDDPEVTGRKLRDRAKIKRPDRFGFVLQ